MFFKLIFLLLNTGINWVENRRRTSNPQFLTVQMPLNNIFVI